MEKVYCLSVDTGTHSVSSRSPGIHISLEKCVNFVATLLISTSLSVAAGTCLASHCLAMDVSSARLWLHTYGVQALCHIIDSRSRYCDAAAVSSVTGCPSAQVYWRVWMWWCHQIVTTVGDGIVCGCKHVASGATSLGMHSRGCIQRRWRLLLITENLHFWMLCTKSVEILSTGN
jgi:hypothetical protein